MQGARSEADRQLPIGDEIFLDHLGHFVRDPDAASKALIRAGFAPTPQSIQVNPDPAGGAPRRPAPATSPPCSLAAISRCCSRPPTPCSAASSIWRLARYRGVHLAAFAVADAADAHQRLAGEGFRMRPLVQMQRPVDTGGAPGTAAFTLARVEPGEMPEGRIQILTHRTEQMVWQPRWLDHPNGALALTSVAIVVADPWEAARRFARFTGRQRRRDVWADDRARPRHHRARRTQFLCANSAGNSDPVPAVHRRLWDQGEIAEGDRRHVAACRRANATKRSRPVRGLARGARPRRLDIRGIVYAPPLRTPWPSKD